MKARIAWLLLAASVTACTRSSPVAQPTPAASGTVRATSTPVTFKVRSGGSPGSVVLTERRVGRVIYVLHADANVANRLGAGTGRSVFTNPRIVFYQEHGRRLTAQSPTAAVEESTKTVTMSGGVHARTQDGVTLACDQLTYDDRHGLIHGEGNVLVTATTGETLSGQTLDADSQLNHVRVSGVGP